MARHWVLSRLCEFSFCFTSAHSLSKTFCFDAALEANTAIMQKEIIEWSESHIRFNALHNWMAEWKTREALSYFTVIKFRAMSGVCLSSHGKSASANEILAFKRFWKLWQTSLEIKRQEVNALNNTFNGSLQLAVLEGKLIQNFFVHKCAGKAKSAIQAVLAVTCSLGPCITLKQGILC